MKKITRRFFSILGGVILLSGCMGGSGVGGSSGGSSSEGTREVTGTLASSDAAALHLGGSPGECAADTVIATDSLGKTITTAVDKECNFAIELKIGKSYVIGFSHGGSFVAVLVFDTGVGFASENITIGEGSGPIRLGSITMRGNVAIPEHNPFEEEDCDNDGKPDFDDPDDDNDGVPDNEETDCDLDGIPDDLDEDNATCKKDDQKIVPELARVLEVKPRNNPHPERGSGRVDLDRDIKARINCLVDPKTVHEDTFRIDHDDKELACVYEVKDDYDKKHSKIICGHEQDMHPDALYVATIEGVKCLDGRIVKTKAWGWLTERSDEDHGHFEDDLDDLF